MGRACRRRRPQSCTVQSAGSATKTPPRRATPLPLLPLPPLPLLQLRQQLRLVPPLLRRRPSRSPRSASTARGASPSVRRKPIESSSALLFQALSHRQPRPAVRLGNRVTKRVTAGKAAPKESNLEAYLASHPDCEVYNPKKRTAAAAGLGRGPGGRFGSEGAAAAAADSLAAGVEMQPVDAPAPGPSPAKRPKLVLNNAAVPAPPAAAAHPPRSCPLCKRGRGKHAAECAL